VRDAEPDVLDVLAKSIADGDSIDWDEIERLPADDQLRRLLRQLRLVADVADLHRSPFDDPAAPNEVDTESAADQSGDRRAQGERRRLTDELARREPRGLGRWGHLLLLRKIGEGAFGEVYHAHDSWLDHPVALKLLKPGIAKTDLSSRILHEARKLARVRHPNVVTVHGADRHDGRIGFWMDLIEGQTLAEIVARGRLNAGEAAYVGQEVCRALTAVHHVNLVHRDVKAQNVMRASDGGRIILMDFGAGEFIDAPSANLSVQGTPLYLAPEIFQGAAPTVQTDVYAVGVLLYHLVTGNFPVSGSSIADLADRHQRGERRHLRDARPDLPDSFVAVVERALRSDPARRYASAGDMLAALAGEPASARITVPPIPAPAAAPHRGIALHRTTSIALVMAGVVIATEILGLIASRTFEVALQVHADFAAGPIEYLSVGAAGLFPFVVYWLAGAALLGVLAALRPLFRSRAALFWKRWAPRLRWLDPATAAAIMFLIGTGGLVALTWSFYDLFNALNALRVGPIAAAADLSILSSTARPLHRAHGDYSAYLSFALGLAAWRWFPRLERQAHDASRVRFLKWATVAVAFLLVALAVAPRRVIWEQFEVVTFENQRAFVIGSSADDLLLYARQAGKSRHWRVRKDASALRRTGQTGWIFDPQ
jgi:serine/threonine-protein kinase